jgi:hypothetical protein
MRQNRIICFWLKYPDLKKTTLGIVFTGRMTAIGARKATGRAMS